MPTSAPQRARTALAALCFVALTTACSGSASSEEAVRTAEAAVQASSTRDVAALCALLAPRTAQQLEQQESAPCPVAAASIDLGEPSQHGPAEVWGSSALVPMGPATVFLTEVDGRWRVLAAGCTLREEQPAQCRLGGG